jgi:hypothetical protein
MRWFTSRHRITFKWLICANTARHIAGTNAALTRAATFSADDWPFAESDTTLAFACRCVFDNQRPILSVFHDDEGEWQFLCGSQDHSDPHAAVVSNTSDL